MTPSQFKRRYGAAIFVAALFVLNIILWSLAK